MEFLIILILILINGAFSMAEIALISARKTRLTESARQGNKAARTALELKSSPGKLFSTVQIGITLVGLLTGVYSGEKITGDLEVIFEQIPAVAAYAKSLSLIMVLIILTFFAMILGELVPKRIGLRYPEAMAKWMAFPMRLIATLMAPFIWLLTITTDFVFKLLRIKGSPDSKVTEEEIKAYVRESLEHGEIRPIEQRIVNRVFSLGDRSVGSLMTSRKKMAFFNVTFTREDMIRSVSQNLHNYYPVFDPENQNIIGIVGLKELFSRINHKDFNLADLISNPSIVADTASAYEALEHFKKSGIHYALVVDEYGTTQGIITLSDILEALVGDVSEFKGDSFLFQQRDEHTWLIDGDFPLPDFLLRFGMEQYIKDYEVNTLGGLIIRELGHIPKESEKISWAHLEFEILDMDGPMIDKVLVTRI